MSFLLSPTRQMATSIPSTCRSFSTSRISQLARMSIIGRLGADPELKQNERGSLLEYSVGAGYGPKDNRQVSWYRVTSFAPEDTPARNLTASLTKGTLIFLEADARMRSYEDSEGKQRTALALYQTKVEILKRPQNTEISEQREDK